METKFKFKNGVEFVGTAHQIMEYAKLIGESIDTDKLPVAGIRGYYVSASRGLLKISDMETHHIINALTKRTVEYFQALKVTSEGDLEKYLKGFISLTEDTAIEDLYGELVSRA